MKTSHESGMSFATISITVTLRYNKVEPLIIELKILKDSAHLENEFVNDIEISIVMAAKDVFHIFWRGYYSVLPFEHPPHYCLRIANGTHFFCWKYMYTFL